MVIYISMQFELLPCVEHFELLPCVDVIEPFFPSSVMLTGQCTAELLQFEILLLNGNPFKGKHGGPPVSEAPATVCKGQKSGLKAAGNSCAVNVSYPEPFMLSGSRLNARTMPIVFSTGYQVSPGAVLCIDGLF